MPKDSTNRQIGRPYKKGEGGRPKGTVNKFTNLKRSFLSVYERMGGDEALLDFAKTHKPLFYQMITKLFPQEVEQIGNVKVIVHWGKPPQEEK